MTENSSPVDPVMASVEDHVARIVLNRPHVRNALDNEALAALATTFESLAGTDCRALVIQGSDATFCAGSDVKALRANGPDYQRWHANHGQKIFAELERAPFLTIAVVAGYCLGGGAELALACDVRVAVADSQWGFPEVTLGAVPSWGGTQRLPRFVGLGTAKRMLLTSERLAAADLKHTGLVDFVEPSLDAALARADSLAEGARAAAPQAFELVKRLALSSFDTPSHVGAWMERLSDDAIAGSIRPLPGQSA